MAPVNVDSGVGKSRRKAHSPGTKHDADNYGLKREDARIAPKGSTIIVSRVSVGKWARANEQFAINQDLTALVPDTARLLPGYLHILAPHIAKVVDKNAEGIGVRGVTRKFLQGLQIPLPPLELQREMAAEIEDYQRVIDSARAVLNSYRPHIPIDPEWPTAAMGDICLSIADGDHQPPPKADEGIPFVTISNLDEADGVKFEKTFFVPRNYFDALKDIRRPNDGDLLYSVTGSYGVVVPVNGSREFCFQRHIALLRPSAKVLSGYLLYYLRSPAGKKQADDAATGVAQKTVSLKALREFKIPLPPIEKQSAIIAEIEAERALVNGNHDLITRFEKKIEAAIARVWGEAKAGEAA